MHTALLTTAILVIACAPLTAFERYESSTSTELLTDASLGEQEEMADSGDADVQKRVAKALEYLAGQQQADGSVGKRYTVAMTSLSGLAMLGAGSTPLKGPRQKEIAAAMEYVQSQQGDDGFLPAAGGSMYEHAFATMFLAECLRVSRKDMRVAAKLEKAVKKAAELIVDAQHDAGGWRYRPQQPGDVTSSSCQVLALDAARRAEVAIPMRTFAKASAFLLTCQHDSGGFAYMPTAGAPSVTRTAACANSLHLAGRADSKELKKALGFLRAQPAPAAASAHYLYYALFMAQVVSREDGKAAEKWRADTAKQLMALQREDGSWPGPMGKEYATAMICLVLQAKDIKE